MSILDTCDSTSEIVFSSKKNMFFFTTIKRKYFVANEQDNKELSIYKIIILDTGLLHVKRKSLVTIKAEIM
jgi:hypothetical protein